MGVKKHPDFEWDQFDEKMNQAAIKAMEPLAAFIIEYYGERCPEFVSTCRCCVLWDKYDEIHDWMSP